MRGIVIVGAGQAGASLAVKLRALGYDGELTLIGEEPVPPYQRPPLSKGYLLGEIELDRLFLRPLAFWKEQKVTLRLGECVTTIDRIKKTVGVGGEAVPYSQLALTVGSRPRCLPDSIGGNLAGVLIATEI